MRYDDNFVEAGFVDEDDELDLQKIKSQWDDAKKMVYGCLKLEEVVIAAFYIAQGMKSVIHKTQKDSKWNTFAKKDFLTVSGKIQGSLDTTLIASSIDSSCNSLNALIRKKGDWLRNWIKDPNTTVHEIRNFLLFATGSTSLPHGQKIRLAKQYNKYLPVPKAHTCSYVLEIAPTACGALGPEFNDGKEEGFLRALQIAIANPTGYQMVRCVACVVRCLCVCVSVCLCLIPLFRPKIGNTKSRCFFMFLFLDPLRQDIFEINSLLHTSLLCCFRSPPLGLDIAGEEEESFFCFLENKLPTSFGEKKQAPNGDFFKSLLFISKLCAFPFRKKLKENRI